MGLEKVLGYINVTVGEPVLAITAASLGAHMLIDESSRSLGRASVIALGIACIAAKNVYDYRRFGRHVEEQGWSPELLKESYGWVGQRWAEAHGQEKEYYGAAPGGWGSQSWW